MQLAKVFRVAQTFLSLYYPTPTPAHSPECSKFVINQTSLKKIHGNA